MSDTFLGVTIREFRRLKNLADQATRQLDDDPFFAVPAPDGNSVALVTKHLAGNLRSRWTDFLTTDGEKPDRDRDSEFELREGDDRAALEARWEQGWTTLFETLGGLGPDDLARSVTIRGEPHTVEEAIQRQLSHYAHHVGQIVLMAKTLCGDAWMTLSVPKSGSVAFNRKPDAYLDGTG